MLRYILRRILWMIPITLGVSIFVFTLVNTIPGDPGSAIMGNASDPEAVEAINRALGHYDPFFVKYFRYMGGLLKGNLGQSYFSKHYVNDEVWGRVLFSLKLASITCALIFIVGVTIGVFSATKQGTLLDLIPRVASVVIAAAPTFFVGLMLILLFAMRLNWLPSFGTEERGWIILPVLTLLANYGAMNVRYTRSSMLENIRQDYIRTVRAKGAAEKRVIWLHALRNALIPVVTSIGSNFNGILGGAIVTESLFSLPGLGTYIIKAVKQRDVPVVMGGVLVLAVLHAFVVLAVDLVNASLDPRVKMKLVGRKR